MAQRMRMNTAAPEGYKAAYRLEQYTRDKVDPDLLHLVKLRASIINSCAFCVDMHTTDWLREGEDVRKVAAVAAWQESPFFTSRERLVLELTEVVTRIHDGGVPDGLWDRAVAELGAELLADLLWAIAVINVWNRVSVATRAAPPPLGA